MSVDKGKVLKLRREGLSLRVIGDRVGVSGERIRQIVGPIAPQFSSCAECGGALPRERDPRMKFCSGRCRRRAHNRSSHKSSTCVDCAAACRGERCVECKRQVWARNRAERFDRIAELWETGMAMADMAAELGTTANALGGEMCRARVAGWKLPFRRAKSPKTKNLTKEECRFQFTAALRQGQIRRATRCEVCGRVGAIDGHHHDYQRPLFVTWLCPPCHRNLHLNQLEAHVDRASEKAAA